MTRDSTIGFTVAERDLDRLDRQLGRLEAIGADAAELAVTPLSCLVGGRVIADRLAAVRKVVRRRSLRITLHGVLAMNFMDESHAPLHRAVASGTLALADALGAPLVVVHPGWLSAVTATARGEDLRAREREGLTWMAGQAAARGITLGLENMPVILETLDGHHTSYAQDPLRLADQIRAINHPALRATMDLSHAYQASRHFGWDLGERLALMAPLTRHLHLHDSMGRPQTLRDLFPGEAQVFGMGDLHLPLGWGDLPYDTVLPALPLPAPISATLETAPDRFDDATLADSLTKARRLLASLRQRTPAAAE